VHFDTQPTGAPDIASTTTPAGVWISERERVRTLRTQRYLAVAVVAGLTLVLISPIADTLLEFALVSILVFVVLNSFGRAMDARLGYLWGWLYPEPERTTRFDRTVDRILHRLIAAGQVDDPPGPVRPL
jgi:hypothetical protein